MEKTIKGFVVYYWTAERGTAEVDFVIDKGGVAAESAACGQLGIFSKLLNFGRLYSNI